MTRENKDLLLKDLCSRLPYGVIVCLETGLQEKLDMYSSLGVYIESCRCKPYLRSMSSMTEKEREELEHLSEEYFGKALDKQIQESLSSSNRNESEILEYIASSIIVDWLNAHHFDYRLLIEKGLALEAPEWIYK